MSEQDTVQIGTQPGAEHEAAGEDVASTIDAAEHAEASARHGSPHASSAAVAEARRYRKRAQAAEKSLDELKATLAERQQQLGQQQSMLDAMQRRHAIDDALHAAGTIDLETARLLMESALASAATPSQTEISQAVEALVRQKPHLFRARPRGGAARSTGPMSPKSGVDDRTPRAKAINDAASDAASSGKRTDLLRYLRLRRK